MNEEDVNEPNIKNLITGKPFKVDCYIERIPNGDLPDANDSEEVYQKFLFKVFERKDELMELHKEYNCFPKAIKVVKKRYFWNNLRFIFLNFILTGSSMAYLLYQVYLSQSMILRFGVLGFILSGMFFDEIFHYFITNLYNLFVFLLQQSQLVVML